MTCLECRRRCWLLGAVNARLHYRGRDGDKLQRLLSLDDRDLISAVGGHRRQELLSLYESFNQEEHACKTPIEALCRHDRQFPEGLVDCGPHPALLNVVGGVARLTELLREPAVAIVGSDRPTDYGFETARQLARGLAASGLTVLAEFRDGVGRAVLGAALEVDGGTLAVRSGGLDIGPTANLRELDRRIRSGGVVISALGHEVRPRPWCNVLRARILTALADLVLVIEAEETRRDLLPARAASELGRRIAAVPGRITSPASCGTHGLLREGAHLVRHTQDVLDLVYGVGVISAPMRRSQLEPRLSEVLSRVGAGEDTLTRLITSSSGSRQPAPAVLIALAELEAMGLLGRGDGGRYVCLGDGVSM